MLFSLRKGNAVMKLKFKLIASLSLIGIVVGGISIAISKPSKVKPTFATYSNGDAATYYSSIDESQSGNTLLTALRTLNLSKRQSTVSYDSMGTTPSGQFKYTDYDTNYVQYDSNNQPYGTRISSFYTYTSATSWNREHVWPNSHGGGSKGDAGSPYPDADIHMPRPTISSENSSRGNSFFVEGMNHSSNGWDPYTAGYSENSRGEAARITFYCTLVNSKLILAPNNTTPSGTDSVTGQSYGSGHTMGNLETLIKWNINYPVTQREKNRNEGAEYLQGNRNAFVDHPEYACKIWGNVNSTIKNMCANASWDVGPSVSISRSTASIVVDDTTMINATASDGSNISWTSSDTNVVTVSSASSASGANITLTGIGPGTATITARATINSTVYSATCTVTVSSSGSGGEGGDTPVSGDYTILYSDAPASYPGSATEYTAASGIKFYAYNVMNQSSKVQFKKSGGYLYNSDSLNIGTLTLSGVSGTLTVYAGTTRNPSSTTISGSNGVYDLTGYNYFKIINSSSSVASCSSITVGIAESTKTLSSIAVATSPTKTTYTAGEYFDPTGLVITRNYSDSTSDTYTYANHTSDFTFSPTTSTALTTSNASVTIAYGGKSTSQAITVNAAVKTLSSISIGGQTTSFTVDDTFSFGGTVTAHFSDSTSSDVTASATFTGYNMSVAGNYTVTVSYTYGGTTKTTSYSITVASSGGSGGGESGDFSGTYNASNQGTGSGKTWTLSDYSNQSSYLRCPESGTESVALISGIFTDKTITSSVVITINSATYGSGGNPTSSTFSVYNNDDCTSQVSATQTGTLPSSSTYTNVIYTVSLANASSFSDDLAIKITKPGKQIRLKSIDVEFSYETSGSSPVTPTSITATVNNSRVFYVGETITKSDITVKTNTNVDVTSSITFANYQFTYNDAPSGGATANKVFSITYQSLPSANLTVQVQRKAYAAPAGTQSLVHTGAEFSTAGIGSSYTTNQTVTVDGITFTVDGYIYSGKLSLSNGKTSAPGKVINTTPYPTGITNVSVSGASPDIQLSVDGSNWVNLSSATPNTVNYFYLKIYYADTSQSNYVNITQIEVTIKDSETAANVANYIMYEDTANQCDSKFDTASGYFNNMSTSERSTFMTSSDYVISTARERFEAWARHLGKTITLNNGVYEISDRLVNPVLKQGENTQIIAIIVVISFLGLSAIGGYFFLKKRKEAE